MSHSYSIVVLAQNEEANIAACLASCSGCDDVHVIDSGSADATREIARACGACVHEHPFETFARQRNWATDNVAFTHDWVLHLDADERLTPELDAVLQETVAADRGEAGFLLPSKLIFMGRWLRRADEYPKYQVRFIHKGRLRFVDYGHGQREEDGATVGRLDEPYLHFPFQKGLEAWLQRHVRYSASEAQEAMRRLSQPVPWRHLVSSSRLERRRALKSLAYRAPCRAQLRWVMLGLLRGGVLEGRPALTYISLVSTYERMVAANIAWHQAESRKSEE